MILNKKINFDSLETKNSFIDQNISNGIEEFINWYKKSQNEFI